MKETEKEWLDRMNKRLDKIEKWLLDFKEYTDSLNSKHE